MPMVTGGEGGGGVGDLIGDANAAGWGFEGGSKASPSGAYASAGTTMGDFMREAMGFFSPMSQAQHDRLMAEEDERREASLDIMGESSQIIAALKAEVTYTLWLGGVYRGWRLGWKGMGRDGKRRKRRRDPRNTVFFFFHAAAATAAYSTFFFVLFC